MNLIKPKNLKIGDNIGIIAPSGGVENNENILRAKNFLENKGYKVTLGKNILKNNRYLAGSDEERLEDLHSFFADPNIDAIICLRGGYGAIRLINKIDYELIKNNPKIFAGYSDVTALSAMFLKKSGLVTFSAPMIQGDFGIENLSEFTMNSFFYTVSSNEQQEYTAKTIYQKGNASGITFGGNLSTIVSLCGLDFIPERPFIFFTEDLNEPVYKIDKMFTQLLNITEFRKNISGLILGEFLDIDNKTWLEDFFKEIEQELNVPTLGGFKITHAKDKLTIPYGIESAICENIFKF